MTRTGGRTLRELRVERGLSREQLSVNTGIPFATIVNIEAGRNRPSIETAEKLYLYFNLPIGSIQWPETRGAAKSAA